MRLWLDDIRRPLDDTWTWVKTVDEARDILMSEDVEIASFDSDLGAWERPDGVCGYDPNEPEGWELVEWLTVLTRTGEADLWPGELRVHTANPVSSKRMREDIERWGPYETRQLISYFHSEHVWRYER